MSRPLAVVSLSFALGIVAASRIELSFFLPLLLAAIFYVSALAYIRRPELFPVFLLFGSVMLGISVFEAYSYPAADHISRFTPKTGVAVRLIGRVRSWPRSGKNKVSFILEAKKLFADRGWKVSGPVMVWSYNSGFNPEPDDLVDLRGTLYQPYPFRINGRLDYRRFLENQGIYSMLSVPKTSDCRILESSSGRFAFGRMARYLTQRAERGFTRFLSPGAAALMETMILGSRGDAPAGINLSLIRTGTVHILAVSGLHVGFIGLLAAVFLKFLRVPFRARYLLVILVLIFYCLLTGGRVPVLRATLMSALLLGGLILGRKYDALNALGLAGIILLLRAPGQIFSVGFQLSFASVFFIVRLSPRLLLFVPAFGKKKAGPFFSSLGVSAAALAGTAGLTAYHFGMFTPIALIANLIIVPLLFIMVCAGAMFLLVLPVPPLALSVAAVVELCSRGLYHVSRFLQNIPGAYLEFEPLPLFLVLAYYALLIVIAFLPLPKSSTSIFNPQS